MCIFFHKWTKWEQYDEEMMLISRRQPNREPIKYLATMQKRRCLRCNYIQKRQVGEG